MAEKGNDIQKAKLLLQNGEVVAIPTETVYGLAGNAFNVDAVTKIFKIKNRPSFDPLIVHTDSLEKIINFVADIPPVALKFAQQFWPGPLTILFSKKDIIPDIVTSGLETVAVRIPNHKLTLQLLQELPFPLAAPSANPFGYISPTKASHVDDQLGRKIKYILDGGDSKVGVESTIIGIENEKILVYRLGGISLEEIRTVSENVELLPAGSDPKAPGMSKSHYAPRKPFILGNIQENLNKYRAEETGILSFSDNFVGTNRENVVILSESGNLEEAARNLFASLRQLDQMDVKQILAELVPEIGLGRAINDRLKRAAAK